MEIPRDFYDRPTLEVARALLGMRLVRRVDGERAARISGMIVETEAYRGEEDLACHARVGRTPRTRMLYGPPGLAYVYFTYGMHWMLNVVTEMEGFPAAVLLRAVAVEEGTDLVAARRAKVTREHWSDGPGKLCQAFGVDGSLNGIDLSDAHGALWIEPGQPVDDALVSTGPRVGIGNTPEPWLSVPWRFLVRKKGTGVV